MRPEGRARAGRRRAAPMGALAVLCARLCSLGTRCPSWRMVALAAARRSRGWPCAGPRRLSATRCATATALAEPLRDSWHAVWHGLSHRLRARLSPVADYGFNEVVDRQWVPIQCTRCRYITDVRIREVRVEAPYVCACCRTTCRLYDHEHRSRRVALRLKRVLRRRSPT